jgi:hypothetical protein
MGRTPKPLLILLTDPSMLQWTKFQELAAQGHQIMTPDEVKGADIVFGPTAHYLVPEMEKYVDEALKAARGRKYQPKEKK